MLDFKKKLKNTKKNLERKICNIKLMLNIKLEKTEIRIHTILQTILKVKKLMIILKSKIDSC
jgi:hypothetical protein